MIYVVELPHEGDPSAWFAFDAEDFFRKVAAADPLDEWEIHDVTTARELLDLVGHDGEPDAAREAFPGICSLGDEHGWDTDLYRADHQLGRGAYQPEPVSVEAACEAALRARVAADSAQGPLRDVRIYWSDPEAVLATETIEPFYEQANGWRALHALREQLLALEVVAEN
ncbi:hypothetical protein [Aquabacterium sp.]|jgi:hypothetical protein|uniref:hypothetical protein n=1 Tax=Aquabacterium sp. TaxID=1872578 RepID=UPI0025BCAE49|nr:hypothetical protein [Aquabacterium sp.]